LYLSVTIEVIFAAPERIWLSLTPLAKELKNLSKILKKTSKNSKMSKKIPFL